MASASLKTAAEATSVWPSIMARGPRCGACVVSDFERFLRLFVDVEAEGRREAGASGLSFAELDQKPTRWSEEAERIREVWELVSTDSMPDLWP